MADPTSRPVLEYQRDDPHAGSLARRRRRLYCIGLPMVGFGLADGFWGDSILNGSVTAIGALLLAFALPVRD